MKFTQVITSSLLTLLPSALAAPTAGNACSNVPYKAGPITKITNVANGTWLENLALRKDGSILTAQYEQQGRLLLVYPNNGTTTVVHTFPNPQSGALGVVEVEPDVFYVLTITRGDTITTPPKGTGQVWRFDMSTYKGAELPAQLITNLTDSILLNGVTVTPTTNKILVGDSQAGKIFRVDPKTGKSDVIASGPQFQNTTAGSLGVNGIHIKNSYLYFTNTQQQKFNRFPIDANGTMTGPVELLGTNNLLGADDFDFFGPNATIIAGDTANKIFYMPNDHANCTVNLTSINGPTALKVVTNAGKTTVFMSTDGGIENYKTGGPVMVAGTISKFDLTM